ncbi:MAG TPA: response regulator transcription factor [Flavisolibacter sp.]|nr:response regulator transcription factor [Flavisolibacter sp.]
MKGTIAIADDHVLLRNGLANLLKDLGYSVLFGADNGVQLIEKLKSHPLPEVILMDISMPLMDGYAATLWLKNHYPSVKVLVLSMIDDEASVIRMFKNGARGYVLKDCHPEELETAIQSLLQKGFYHSEMISGKLIRAINHLDENGLPQKEQVQLNEREIEFLRWICSELSYKEIADKMSVSPRTVDGYRDTLQDKLECKGRIGLVLWAIKHGIVKV